MHALSRRFLRLACVPAALLSGTARLQAQTAQAADLVRPPAPAEASEDIHAQLVARRFTTLSSDTPGQIEHMSVREGDRFRQGQVLVGLDCALQRAQLAEARAILAGALKANAVNRRMVELHSGGILEADLAAAEVAKDEARVQSALVLQSKCTIVAPYQGRVVEQKVREHQFVQSGQAMLDILDDSALEVEFIAPSRWLAWIRPGQDFRVRIEETGRTYPARVTIVGAKVDAVSHSIKITGEIEASQNDLVAGMSGRILMTEPQ